MTTQLQQIKRRVSNKVRLMNDAQCKDLIKNIHLGIGVNPVRDITGGFASQSICEFVRLKLVERINHLNE